MDVDRIRQIAGEIDSSGEPHVEIIKPASATGRRIGVFASSFNPPTIAHVELIQRAADAFSLDGTLALAGKSNADKVDYECSLEDRLAMLTLAFADESRVAIGLSSHAFYADMLDALERVYPKQTDLHFIVGFDTFERVLDPQDAYTRRYYRQFTSRVEALEFLFARSSFIVASRGGAGLQHVRLLVEHESAVPPERVLYLDFPADLGELSATDVRARRRAGNSFTGLVPKPVETFIEDHGLYVTGFI